MKHIILLLGLFAGIVQDNVAQRDIRPTIAWFMPGVSYKYSSSLKFTGQLGIATPQPAHAVYLQSFIRAGKYVTLNPAYLYLRNIPANGYRQQEHTLMNAVIINVPLKNLLIDDRNLFWNRFRQHTDNIHFYRNRLRVGWTFTSIPRHPRFYVYDEVFYLFNSGAWTRNRIAAGIVYDLLTWFNLDVSYVRQADKGTVGADLFFIMGVIQLKRKGIE